MTAVDRIIDAVGDRRNVAGLVGAAAGLAATFEGVIAIGWPLIVGGLYAAGFLAVQVFCSGPAEASTADVRLPLQALPDRLRAVATAAMPQLPPAGQTSLQAILDAVAEIEPRLAGLDPALAATMPLRGLLERYVPDSIANYLRIPRRLRSELISPGTETADNQITRQMNLLAKVTTEMATNLAAGDLDALRVQGGFLAARFKDSNTLS